MLSIVVAYDRARGIGYKNRLPWGHHAEDMAHFRELTTGGAVIMGRRTFESIGRPLPRRLNIVLSSSPLANESADLVRITSFAEAAAFTPNAFVIGGLGTYHPALAVAGRIYATEMHGQFHADTRFPVVTDWIEVERKPFREGSLPCDFVVYEHPRRSAGNRCD